MNFETNLRDLGQAALAEFDRKNAAARAALEDTLRRLAAEWDAMVDCFAIAPTPEAKALAAWRMLEACDAIHVQDGEVFAYTGTGRGMRLEHPSDIRMLFAIQTGKEITDEVAGLLWSTARLHEAYQASWRLITAPWRLAALAREQA